MTTKPRRFWLSFVDTARQADGELGLIGVCVVEITDDDIEHARERIARVFPDRVGDEGALLTGAALYVSHRDGCNPRRGDVVVIPVSDETWMEMENSGVKASRMFTEAQLQQWAKREDVVDNEAAP
jgi:hypothetical protein